MMRRVALFERVSTDEQARFGFSIQTQIDALTEYCQKNSLKIVDHYCDEGVSAGKPYQKRPEMKRLLDDVESGKIDLILFTRLDRWFRNVKEYFKVQEILDRHNVQWKAIWEDYDTTTANGRMAVTIFLAIAQNEREKTSERIKVVFENKTKNGEFCSGNQSRAFGYMIVKDENGKNRMVKNPDEQEACEAFWESMLQYRSLSRAIRLMQDKYNIYKSYTTWSFVRVNTCYYGERGGNQNFCEPYITKEQFDEVQLKQPLKHTPSGLAYYFSGKIICPSCGKNHMVSSYSQYRNKKYKQYRACMNCHVSAGDCKSYSESKIEQQLIANLKPLIKDAIHTAEIENAKIRKIPKKYDTSKLKEKLRRLNAIYMAGNISDTEYTEQQSAINAEIRRIERFQPEPIKDTTHLKKLLETDFSQLYDNLSEVDKQKFWQNLIEEITLENRCVASVKFI